MHCVNLLDGSSCLISTCRESQDCGNLLFKFDILLQLLVLTSVLVKKTCSPSCSNEHISSPQPLLISKFVTVKNPVKSIIWISPVAFLKLCWKDKKSSPFLGLGNNMWFFINGCQSVVGDRPTKNELPSICSTIVIGTVFLMAWRRQSCSTALFPNSFNSEILTSFLVVNFKVLSFFNHQTGCCVIFWHMKKWMIF